MLGAARTVVYIKRGTRLAHRPEGCRAHFAGLLPLA